MQMADMEESFESSDEASDSGKQGSDQQNEASENEMEHSGNEGGESGDENADSGNENVASEEEPSSPVESEAEEGRGESSDERQSEAHSEHGESEDGGNVDSDNQNVSDNEEGGSQNAESDNENAASGNERESEGERVASDNENANSDDEHENVRASDDEGSYEEQAQERTNVESEDERSDQGDDDNERNSEQEDVEGSANEQENDNQEASGAESEREVAGSDSEQEQPEGGQSDVEMNSDDGANGEADEEAAHRGSEAEESDNEGDSHESKKEATAEALFGDADDISSGSDAEGKTGDREDKGDQELADGSVKGSPMQTAQDEHDEEAQEEQQPEEIPETRIDVEIPKITTDLGKEIHFVKLPNFISVETRPFDHQTYEDEIDEDEVLDEEGRARLKLKVENTVRWRWGYDNDGNPVKESNARIVKWSDGSMSLNLGSEIFDVHKQLLQGDHNHLFIRQGTGLQGQAVFRTKLTFRPHSTDSFTHRKITMSVADRSQKTQKIRILPTVGKDPEAHRSEMIKKEEDRLKASIRRENKQRRMKERAISRGLSSSYLEPDRYEDEDEEDDGAISLAAIKNKYKKGALRENRPPIYSSDSDASDIDDRRARRLEKAKALSDSDEGSIEEVGPKKKMARIEESDEDDD